VARGLVVDAGGRGCRRGRAALRGGGRGGRVAALARDDGQGHRDVLWGDVLWCECALFRRAPW